MVYVACGAYVRAAAGKPLARAALLLQQDQPEDARGALRWLLWFEPDHPGALHLTALSYLREQDIVSAIEHLERISDRSPVYHDAQLDLSTALLADRQFQRAETVLNDHLARYPDSLLARRQLSGLLLTERRQREAIVVLEEMLAASEPLAPADHLLLLRDLATAEFHPPPAENCTPALEEAIARNPDQIAVRAALAQCRLELGDVDRADELLPDASNDPRTRLTRCAILIEQGDLDAAESVLAGVQDSPSGPAGSQPSAQDADDTFWEMQCRIAERRGDFELALTHLDHAISLRPPDSEDESRRARLLQRLGRTEDARTAYSRAHELARSELDLWDISRDIGVRTPTPAECEHVAQLYESVRKPRQASAWRHLAVLLESGLISPDPA